MARRSIRRSSRLRKRSSTPKENSQFPGAFPEDDAPAQEKSNLASLEEAEEPNDTIATPAKTSTIPLNDAVEIQATPNQNTPIRPEPEEMHPGHHQSTTTKPLEDARWLGFMEKGAQTEPVKSGSKIPMMQNTPTKVSKMPGTFSPPGFQFTFRHPSLELSPAAKKAMSETRHEAAKIRAQAQLSAEGSALPSIQEQVQRKIALPKGKAGRFSDIHMAEFKKMDSIANHPSSFRADPNRFKQSNSSLKPTSSKAELDKTEPSDAKSLKRSKSKADIDNPESSGSNSKPVEFKIKTGGLEAYSPAKRFKAHYEDDATATRPISRDGAQQTKSLYPHESTSRLPAVAATPTKSSLARSESIKSVKSGIPSLARSPSKPSVTRTTSIKTPTISLVTQLSSKEGISTHIESGEDPSSLPLLARSPSKKPAGQRSSTEESDSDPPLLSRSPSKRPVHKATISDSDEPQAPSTPLLSRSPSKKVGPAQPQEPDQIGQHSNIPLLSRTPAKISVIDNSPFKQPVTSTQTPAMPSSSLRNRFAALRGAGSAMKSILRSPQRLYSDDPFKIAAGTHVAVGTPPHSIAKAAENKGPPAVPSAKKQVDFDNSPAVEKRIVGSPSPVKARSKAMDKMDVTYPSLPPRSPLPTEATVDPQSGYPDLSPSRTLANIQEPQAASPVPAPSTAPGSFTFRVGTPITFGPAAVQRNDRGATPQPHTYTKPTIRHVRPSVTLPSSRRTSATASTTNDSGKGKKRKLSTAEEEDYDKENAAAAAPSVFDIPDDEDSSEARPAKKLRRAETDREEGNETKAKVTEKKVKTGSRLPRIGGTKNGAKARAGKRTSGVLSQARLNLLATPKRRKGE